MGGKRRGGGGEGPSTASRARSQTMSLREECSGRTHVDEATMLRVQHLQRLAAWAGAEAGVGPVGALLGRRLATSAEAAGVPVSTTTFLCQRCETILKPGFNCTVRIRKKRKKTKGRKKSNCCQNSISYACHFCGDQNLILGSGKGVVKSLLSSREQGRMDSTRTNFRVNKGNTKTQDMNGAPENSQAPILQVDWSSRLTQLTSERVEQGERLKLSPPTDCKMDERATLSSVESGDLTFEEGSIQNIVLENAGDEYMDKAEPFSSRNTAKETETCEANVTLESEFVTPRKNKLMDSAEPFGTKDISNKKGEASHSIAGKTPSSSSKPVPNDSRRHSKSARSDGTQLSGSSRKRARKGWTTLRQIAERDEIERKQKLDNFTIPFFMQ